MSDPGEVTKRPMSKEERFAFCLKRYKSNKSAFAREVLMAWPTNRILPNIATNYAHLLQDEAELRALAAELKMDLETFDRA